MPPRARTTVQPTPTKEEHAALIKELTTPSEDNPIIKVDSMYQSRAFPLLQVGQLVNIVNGGRTLQNYEVLAMDDRFIKFRADMSVAPQTEVVLIPYAQIEAIGLVGER